MKIKQTRNTLSDTYLDAVRIRQVVFVKGQGVPMSLEIDENEAYCLHFVLYDEGVAKGTVRLLTDLDEKTALVQRMAILKEARGHGYAAILIDRLIEFAKETKLNKLELHAQLSARGLYSKFHFNEVGQIFEEAGIQHIQMERTDFSDQ